jgi:alpha-N-arabinofuranosidase
LSPSRRSRPAPEGVRRATTVTLDASDRIADVDPRVFGGFLEHMGRCVYEGVYEPTSRHADEHGCRTDVLEQLARLRMTAVRYPGGNFVSGYDWRDGVGPRAQRPVRVDRAWSNLESNQFGTDEFLQLADRMGWTPMMAVNLGTGTPESAGDLVAYCNAPVGTPLGDERAANGHPEPYDVGLWCLGNEMDGPWQIGHTTVEEYTRRAREAAACMRQVSPGIEVVACGSSDPNLRHFPSWDRAVLAGFGPGLDHLSVHRYARKLTRDTRRWLSFGRIVDAQIDQLRTVLADVAHAEGWERTPTLSFDEWNVWYRTMPTSLWRTRLPARVNGFAPPLIEEVYTLEDALVVAGFLNSFLRNADLVRIANIAQVVNVIAPLLTRGDDLLVQSIHDAFRMFSERRSGDSLRVTQRGPTFDLWRAGTQPVLDVTAVLGRRELHVLAVNRDPRRAAPLQVELSGRVIAGVGECEVLTAEDPRARNTWRDPDRVRARPLSGVGVTDGSADVVLPPVSLAAVSLRLAD